MSIDSVTPHEPPTKEDLAWALLLYTGEPQTLAEALASVVAAAELLELAIGGAVLDCAHTMPDEDVLRKLHFLAGQVRVLADHAATAFERERRVEIPQTVGTPA